MARFITKDGGVIEEVKRYRAAANMAAFSKEEQEDAKKNIMFYMQEEGVALMEAGANLVKLTSYTSVRFDTMRFRKDYPELARQYTVESEAVRMTVKDA